MHYKIAITLLVSLALSLSACDSNKDVDGKAPSSAEEPTAEANEEPAAADKADETSDEASDDEQKAAEPKSDQSFAGLSQNENFYVEITPEPNPIPFQELFTLDIRVMDPEDKKTAVEGVSIDQVRATMPAHKHGMKVEPKVTEQDDGTFLVEGMKFHMQGPGEHGRWVIEAVLNDGQKVEKVSYDVQCCVE